VYEFEVMGKRASQEFPDRKRVDEKDIWDRNYETMYGICFAPEHKNHEPL